MKPWHLLVMCAVAVSTLGCPKDEKADGKGDKPKKEEEQSEKKEKGDDKGKNKKKPASDDDGEKKKSKEPTDEEGHGDEPKTTTGHSIGGVAVPAWSKPVKSSGKCAATKADDAKLTALQKGDDGGAGFDDGKGDVDAIVGGMKKACASAGSSVSQALNTGGYTRYSKKQYAMADGWFARALVADPSNTFSRYNLACNLALEGKSADSLWTLEQLVPAAKAGDPRAMHYLAKAKSDTDLDSVRKDPKFVAAMSEGDAIAKAHPCSEGEVYSGTACIKVCNGFGTTGNCDGGKTCSGAGRFGDGLVPYCADPVKCKAGEDKGYLDDDNGMPDPKASCVVKCGDDAACPAGKTCSAYAHVMSPTGGADGRGGLETKSVCK